MTQISKSFARIAAFLCIGCTATLDVPEGAGPGVHVRDSRAPGAAIRMNSVAIVDKSLQKWDTRNTTYRPEWLSIFSGDRSENEKYSKIAVEATNARRTPTGTLEVWATFRNRTDYPLTIECRVQFFGPDAAPVEGPTAWQRVNLPEQSIASYREFSTHITGIEYYYIEVREGR